MRLAQHSLKHCPWSTASMLAAIWFVLLSLAVNSTPATTPAHPPGAPSLSHGPMLGAVSDQSVMVWARVNGNPGQSFAVSVVYGMSGGGMPIFSDDVVVDQSTDFTGVVEITGLLADTPYWYRMRIDGLEQPAKEGTFTTLPSTGLATQFSFALGSCNDHLQMPYPVFDQIAGVDFILHIGDIIYADRSPPAQTQAEFAARYQLNFSESSWRSAMANLPAFMIWDDHEITNDWAAGMTGLYLQARPAFDDYVASHNPQPVVPGELYFTFMVGDVGFFVLDTRSYRDLAGGSMLGANQKTDLFNWLLSSEAPFKFVVSSVPFNDLASSTDTWFGYPAERAEIFSFIETNSIGGVVLLTGDRHWMGIIRHEAIAPIYLYELSSSPLGGALANLPAPNFETVYLDNSARGFMRIAVDTQARPARVSLQVVSEAGEVHYSIAIDENDIARMPVFGDGFESLR